MSEQEECRDCGEYTGRAGRADDSLYAERTDTGDEVGPLCWECWSAYHVARRREGGCLLLLEIVDAWGGLGAGLETIPHELVAKIEQAREFLAGRDISSPHPAPPELQEESV